MWRPTKVLFTFHCVFFLFHEVSSVSNNTDRFRNVSIANGSDQSTELVAADSVREDLMTGVIQKNDTSVIGPVLINVTKVVDVPAVRQTDDNNVMVPVVVNLTTAGKVVKGDDRNKTVSPPLIVIEEKEQPISDLPSVDARVKFDSIGSMYCQEKSKCNSTTSPKTCHCDKLCKLLQDCCEDANVEEKSNLTLSQLGCIHIPGVVDKEEGLMVVTKCSPFWNDNITKNLCEETAASDDIYSHIPVSESTHPGLVYKNRHCAHCNNKYVYAYWKATVLCLEDNVLTKIDIGKCDLSYQMPGSVSSFRKCIKHLNVISECGTSYTDVNVRSKCSNSPYSIVHTNTSEIYRNRYCAECNGVEEKDMYCEQQHFPFKEFPVMSTKLYNFRMTVDFNSKLVSQDEQPKTPFNECRNNEVFDPIVFTCREIFCPPSTLPLQGKCDPVPLGDQNFSSNHSTLNVERNVTNISRIVESIENCTLTKIKHYEFNVLNDSNGITIRDIVFNESEYLQNGTDVLVCLKKLNMSFEPSNHSSNLLSLYHYNEVESYITLVGLIVSITASLLTLFVYILFPQLLNVPGKNLVCLTISLIISQTLFLVAPLVAHKQTVCAAMAVLMHYSFLCAFCWMNIIAFDLWTTFSHKLLLQRHKITRSKRFYFYSAYAWGLPIIIVSVAVILNYVSTGGKDAELFQPKYGRSVCWITTKYALLLFFVGPLAIFKLFDFVLFVFTAYHIYKAKKQGAFARKKSSAGTFCINVRLSLVMGLTWAFAFVANFTNNFVMWYLFIIFNTLQGLFIALSFLCTRRVVKLFREKYNSFTSEANTTKMTALSGERETMRE